MSDYIEREAVIQTICGECGFCEIGGCDHDCDEIAHIKDIPAADVKPVMRGEWIANGNEFDEYGFVICSVCGARFFRGDSYNFCPNCGARMDGGTGEEINGDI